MATLGKKLTKTQVIAKGKKLDSLDALTIAFLPNKAAPQSVWVAPYYAVLRPEHFVVQESGRTEFQDLVNNFEYYNCTGQLGTYAHFYEVLDY